MADLSPMMKQYFEIKEQNPDTLLFFRLGDFYELFFEDAKLVSAELDLTLTGRDCGQAERAPMCGVPYHSAEGYLARLVAKGYKVAICEQMENPAQAKGIVKRDVVRVITPGTVLESSMLDESRNNFICTVCTQERQAGVCFADVSTGELHATTLQGANIADLEEQLKNELTRFAPREILINPATLELQSLPKFLQEKLSVMLECLEEEQFDQVTCRETVQQQFDKTQAQEQPLVERAVGALLGYLKRTQRTGMERMDRILLYTNTQYMRLDLNARRNLELTETMRSKEKKGSLLWVLDQTKTPMGKRLMRTWLERPLLNPVQIEKRQNAVGELVRELPMSDGITEQLAGIHDLERLMTRIVYGSANGRDLRSLLAALERLPALQSLLAHAQCELLQSIVGQIDLLQDVAELIFAAIVEEPPFSTREGGIIKTGYHQELDNLKQDMNGGKTLIAQMEAQEKERTKIPKLKIGYNRVFGYYIEISNSYKEQAPQTYIRKQTLSNCERYITQELKDLEARILGAHDKAMQLESVLFEEIRRSVAEQLGRVQRTATAIAQLDVLNAFAVVARRQNYVCPQVNLSGNIILKESRHPVVEVLLNGAPFVPNDVYLDRRDNRVAIITGPNMAGKSTYMRQVALIVLMAQIGSFVPATQAEIGIVDSIFTRVGASDDLAAGQSTFMVEMTEVAEILQYATDQSLLILDEIGRGTSTFDGMSIARAVLEYTANAKTLGAKALFATHYHELTVLENTLDSVKNYNIAVKRNGDDITFLRRIVRGGADDSFGIAVAKLAGVPNVVITRAKEILQELESGTQLPVQPKQTPIQQEAQLSFAAVQKPEVLRCLEEIDVNALTPIECMQKLFELSQLAKREQ